MTETSSVQNKWERGQGLVEYALILSLVSMVCVVVLSALGQSVRSVFERIQCSLNSGGDCAAGCVNEEIYPSGTCIGNTLIMNITSSCQGAQLSIQNYGGVPPDGNISIPSSMPGWAGTCTAGVLNMSTEIHLTSLHPDGSYRDFTLRPMGAG